MDLTDRIEYEDKHVTVLDDVGDVRSVLAKYKAKGWESVHASRPAIVSDEPATVVLHLQRPKRKA